MHTANVRAQNQHVQKKSCPESSRNSPFHFLMTEKGVAYIHHHIHPKQERTKHKLHPYKTLTNKIINSNQVKCLRKKKL